MGRRTCYRENQYCMWLRRRSTNGSLVCVRESHGSIGTLIVTRGVVDLGPFVDEGLPKFWEEYVKNGEVPAAARKDALIAWLWVRSF